MKSVLARIGPIALAALLAVPAPAGAAVDVRIVSKTADLPGPFRPVGATGDLLVSDGRVLALIGGSDRALRTTLNLPTAGLKGSVIGFIPAGQGGADRLAIGAPVLIVGGRTRYLTCESVQPRPDASGRALSIESRAGYDDAEGRRARVATTFRFAAGSGRVEVLSTLTNTGPTAFQDLDYHLYFNAQSSYSFNPYDRERFPRLNVRVYQKPDHALAWLNLNPVPSGGDPLPGTLAPGASYSIRYILFADETPEAVLASIFRELKVQTETARLIFRGYQGDRMEVIVRDPVCGSTLFRAFLENRPVEDVALPAGIYEVTAHMFPAAVKKFLSVAPGAPNECVIENPPQAGLEIRLRDRSGRSVPGKVTFVGLASTRSPFFRPDDPVASGRGWEGVKNHVYPDAKGSEVILPAGIYLVTGSRGPEYSIAQDVVSLLEGDRRELVLTIDRAVETPGLISLDPHLHTRDSDGSNTIPERVRSLVAEGVDVAVATDHNFVNDYAPALAELGLEDQLAVVSGDEVTPPDNSIHFNLYPLTPAPDQDNQGAISALGGSPEALFTDAGRQRAPLVRQVNHPRAGDLGYFNNFGLDPETAGSAADGFSLDFDVLEVMNGPVFGGGNDRAVADWLHLLNRGFYYPAVGSSDSHGIDGEEPGYSRTYVRYAGGEGRSLDRIALIAAVRQGRSFVSNGPIVELAVDDRFGCGDTLTRRDGKVPVRVEVRAAPWIDVDEVCLIVNGQPGLIFPVGPARDGVLAFRRRIDLALARDSYLVCRVTGRRPLFPAVQVSGLSADEAARPFAITNPVFIDVDGNGRYDAPLPREIRIGAAGRRP